MKKLLPFLFFWLLNSAILYLTFLYAPQDFGLGNVDMSPLSSALASGLLVTGIVWFARPVFNRFGYKLKREESLFVFYWVANSVALWLVAHFPSVTGFGVSVFYYPIILGLVMNIAQWFIWQICLSKNLVRAKRV